MSRIVNALTIPLIIASSLPLVFFAVFTTSLALVTLLARVSVLYVELGLALLQSALGQQTKQTAAPFRPHTQAADDVTKIRLHPRSRRSSAQSGSSSTSLASASLQVAAGPPSAPIQQGGQHGQWPSSTITLRDYESVGGWRLPTEDEDEERLWMGMNSRLVLPALSIPSPSVGRGRPRALSGGFRRNVQSVPCSTFPSGHNSPLVGRSPNASRQGRKGRKSGTASPEGYFGSMSGGPGSSASSTKSLEMSWSSGRSNRSSTGESLHKTPSRNASVSLVKLSGET